MRIAPAISSFIDRYLSRLLLWLLASVGLYYLSLRNYLLFHNLAEIFSIVVAATIFIIAWDVRRSLENGYLFVIGVAFLFVGAVDLLHNLAFKGMGVFPEYDTNLPTQLWLAARFLQAFAFLWAMRYLHRKPNPLRVWLVYAGLTLALVGSIFLGFFPTAYIEGQGLTPFKIYSEYAICLLLAVILGLFYRRRQEFDPRVWKWLALSLGVEIASELTFTQ